MAHLKAGNMIVATHKITVTAILKIEESENKEEKINEIKEFAEKEIEKYRKVSLESFKVKKGNLIEVIVYTSEPDFYFSEKPGQIPIRTSDAVGNDTYIYLFSIEKDLPKGIKINREVKVEQILFPETKNNLRILY